MIERRRADDSVIHSIATRVGSARAHLNRVLVTPQPRHIRMLIMAAIDELNQIATDTTGLADNIKAAVAKGVADSEAALEGPIAAIKTNVAAALAAAPAPVVVEPEPVAEPAPEATEEPGVTA